MLIPRILLFTVLLVAPIDSGRIAGRVVDTHSGAGVAAARVALDGGSALAATDDEGYFVFSDVPSGSHTVSAVIAGFSVSPGVPVLVAEGEEAKVEIRYALQVSTEVRGTTEGERPVLAPTLGGAILRGRDVAATVGGLDDVSRVLQLHPGVVASQDDRNDLIVRGGGAMETQVVADGFDLPTASHFGVSGSASGGISLIPSDVIERASIAAGGFSAAYGERASSIVRIDLRGGGTTRLSGAFSAGAGGVLVLARGKVGAGGGWLASARRSILETAFSRGNATAVPRYRDLVGRLTWALSPTQDLRLLLLGASDSADVEATQGARLATIDDEQRLALAGVGLRSRWSESTSSSIAVSFSTNEIDAYRTNAGAIDGREYSRERDARVRAEVRRTVPGGAEATAGITVRRSSVGFDLQDTAHRNQYGIYIPALRSKWQDDLVEPATYVEVAAPVGRRVNLLAGFRGERPGFSHRWFATPRLRLEYTPARALRVAAGWGVYRQAIPNIWMAASDDNRDLAPIRCVLSTIGAEWRAPGGVSVAAEGFVKRYSGYPVDPAEPPRVLISGFTDFDAPFVGRLIGSGRVHASGVDATAARRLGARLDLAAGYSHWRVVQRGLDLAWRPADYDVRHQARLMATWRPAPRWSVAGSWRYASGRPYTPFDVAASIRANAARYDRQRTNAEHYSPYARLDARVERLFIPGRTVVTVFAEVENLTGHDNIYLYTWSRTGRRADPIYQWGRLPVAGLRLEF